MLLVIRPKVNQKYYITVQPHCLGLRLGFMKIIFSVSVASADEFFTWCYQAPLVATLWVILSQILSD